MRKSKKILGLVAGGIFAAMLVTSVSIVAFDACDGQNCSANSKHITGNGKIVTKSAIVTEFNAINVGGQFEVVIDKGKQSSASVTTDENILPYVNMSVSDHTLNVGIQSGISVSASKIEKVNITTLALHNINLGGDAILRATKMDSDDLALSMGGKSVGYLQGDIKNLQIKLLGKSELHVDVANSNSIDLNIAGNGTVYLSGTVKKLSIATAGKALVFAKNLTADEVAIAGAGKSEVTIHAVKTLSVLTAGQSHIKYYGDPTINKNAFGDVTVEKLGS